jgi:hypothetical protein
MITLPDSRECDRWQYGKRLLPRRP